MKFSLIILALFFLNNCSFDNKSGIWNNEKGFKSSDKSLFSEFKTLSVIDNSFYEILPINKDFKFRNFKKIKNSQWKDYYYQSSNNFENFEYREKNKLVFKSKKITKFNLNGNLIVDKNNLILSDQKGNVITFSLTEKKILSKYNFYKNKYKQLKKVINFAVENSTIYLSDNFGYLYAYDYNNNKVIWAKNYKIPFRSNMKLTKNFLIVANQNNNLYFFDKTNGDIVKLIPTEETVFKNKFISNLAMNEKYLFFLNTYGSLYSFDKKNMKINWFVNLNQTTDLNPSNLFLSNQIINHNKKLIISSNKFLYVLNEDNGSVIFKKNFSSTIKPLVINDYLFVITKKDLLISMDLKNGEIIYSYDLNQKIADYLNTKKKDAEFLNLIMANDKIFVFLKNSFFLKLDLRGNLKEINKLPTKIYISPIFVDKNLVYVDKNRKILIN